jgi:hypothetical protein
MKADFSWPRELRHREGAPCNLEGIDVFFDFDWNDVVGHPQTQFPFGQCLARRVREECPDDLTPALLLTDCDAVEEKPIEGDGFYAVVINLRRYLTLANNDASAAYFGDSYGGGLTRISELDAVAGMSAAEIDALVSAKLTREGIERWVGTNMTRIEALQEIIAAAGVEQEPPSAEDVVDVIRGLEDLDPDEVAGLGTLISDPDKRSLVDFINENQLLSDDLVKSFDFAKRSRAVTDFEQMLAKNLTEAPWQDWFKENNWVLGTEFVRVLDARPIDVEHIADYLMEAYDGFLDLIEIKRPEGKSKFWADAQDHGNYIPHTELVKAITQASRYILEVEHEANSVKFLERIGGVKAIKPRCVLVFGRSQDWNDGQREAYRILNASYHNLTILTFDHVLARARRILDLTGMADDSDVVEGR